MPILCFDVMGSPDLIKLYNFFFIVVALKKHHQLWSFWFGWALYLFLAVVALEKHHPVILIFVPGCYLPTLFYWGLKHFSGWSCNKNIKPFLPALCLDVMCFLDMIKAVVSLQKKHHPLQPWIFFPLPEYGLQYCAIFFKDVE